MKKYINAIIAQWLAIILFVCLLVLYAEYSIGDEQTEASKYYQLGIFEQHLSNYETAVTNFRKSIEKGNNVDAQYELGKCYLNGLGVKRDNVEAYKWFQKAAEQEHIQAMTELGLLYLNDTSGKKDDKESAKWFLKAAELGNPKAQHEIGLQYFNGLGVEKNQKKGIRWLTVAAEQEYVDSQCMLGTILITGKDGFEKNVTEGIKWLNKVSDKNDPTDTKTNLQLYELYLNGEYVEKDIDKAVYYALKVAKTRQLFHLPQSDDTDAIIISTENIMAAEKGDDIAQVCLGTQYFLKNDFKEAQKWFKLSEEKGSFEARFIIGFRIRSRVIIVSI